LTVAVVATLGLAPPLVAGEAQDKLFTVGALGEVAVGQRLVFDHQRAGTFDATALPPIEDGEIVVALEQSETGDRVARVTLSEAGRGRGLDPMAADGGHPLLLVFLETVVSDVARLTGGSPFYIRNRMREALAEQDTVEPVEIERHGARTGGERLTFRPFVDDPNRAELGALADLELRVTLSDATPGGLDRLEAVSAPAADADAPPAFSESVVFERQEAG
jgi:hypothetical protein